MSLHNSAGVIGINPKPKPFWILQRFANVINCTNSIMGLRRKIKAIIAFSS